MNSRFVPVRTIVASNIAALLTLSTLAIPTPLRAQRITSPSPAINAEDVEPSSAISVTFQPDNGTTIRPDTVKVFLDDTDVTSQAVITGDFLSYRPATDLSPGEHTVRLEFTNSAGDDRQAEWSFSVGTPIVADIESVSHNGANEPLAAGQNLLVSVNGTPGSRVSVFLVRDGSTVKSLATEEVSQGVYVASLPVTDADLTDEGIVVARLEKDSQIRFATADQPLTLVAETAATAEEVELESAGEVATGEVTPDALQPTVTSHQDGDSVSGSSFELVGTTAPNASVKIVGTAENSLGGLISTQRSLVERTVQADEEGNFSLRVSSGLATISGSVYTIELTASAGGVTSATTTIELVQE